MTKCATQFQEFHGNGSYTIGKVLSGTEQNWISVFLNGSPLEYRRRLNHDEFLHIFNSDVISIHYRILG